MKRWVLAFLLCCGIQPLMAAQLPTNGDITILSDFAGGLNTAKASHKLNLNESPEILNALIDEKQGSIVKRNGFTLAGSTNVLSKVNFLGEFIKDNGDREMIVSDSSRVLVTRDFQTYTLIKTTLTPTAILRMAQGRGKALLCNGVDPCFFRGSNGEGGDLDGNNNFPNIPRGAFPAYYQERFWVYKTSANNSALHFSALTSTDGFILDPLTDNRAWPVINQLNIALGDGYSGSGLTVFNGQLQAHKYNRSVYTIFGTDELTYTARRTISHVGTIAQDSNAQGDNLEYFLAKDGVYASDSGDAVRISDQIQPDIDTIVTNLTNIQSDTWDTFAEFTSGSTIQNTSTTAAGYVTLLGTHDINAGLVTTPGQLVFVPAADAYAFNVSSFTNYIRLSNASMATGFNAGYLDRLTVAYANPGATNSNVNFFFVNTRTGGYSTGSGILPEFKNAAGTGELIEKQSYSISPKLWMTKDDVDSGNILFKMDSDKAQTQISSVTKAGTGELWVVSSTGQFVSEITTITTISFWDTFNANTVTNGGTINFFIKTAPGLAFVATQTWTQITPGAVIDMPVINRWVQWSSTFNGVGVDISSYMAIDNVTINHNEGASSDTRPLGITWKNRYWLVVTTQTSGTNSAIYVKSKITNSNPNAWVKFTGINLKSISKFGDSLYGGSASSGTIYRLDYGTNDNGIGIPMIYVTPDLDLGNRYFEKKQREYLIDADRSAGATLTFGTSVNGGSYTNQSVSLDGTGRLLKEIPYNAGRTGIKESGFYFRYKFANSELDKPINFHAFGLIWVPGYTRPND